MSKNKCTLIHVVLPINKIEMRNYMRAMYKTHRQLKCPDCGEFNVWKKMPKRRFHQ